MTLLLVLMLAIPALTAHAQHRTPEGKSSPDIPSLTYQLQDDDAGRKYQAATALIQIQQLPPDTIDRMFQYPIDPAIQKAFVDAGPRALPLINSALASTGDQRIRTGAVSLLGAMARRWPELWQVLVDKLRDDDFLIRSQATAQFGNLSETEERVVVPLLRPSLRDPDARTRVAALNAFFGYGFGATRRVAPPEIAGLLKDPDPRVRSTAANVLARISPPPTSAVPELLAALNDPVREVRISAASALLEIDPHHREIVPIVVAALATDESYARAVMLNDFAKMGPDAKDAIPVIERLLASDPDPQVRGSAAFNLPKVADGKAAAVPLGKAVASDKNLEVRKEALQQILNLGDDGAPAIPSLIACLRDSNADIRSKAIDLLGFLKVAAVPALVAALQSPDLNLQQGAIEALARNQPLPDAAIRALTSAAFKDKSRAVRNDAAKVLEQAKIDAGKAALEQLAKESDKNPQPAKVDEKTRRYTKEEIVATIPSDRDHAYPMRLVSLLPIKDTEFVVALHHGADRPDRLAIWKTAGENLYRLIQVMTTDEEQPDAYFEPPTAFTPTSEATGDQVAFLEVVTSGWRYRDATVYAVDPETEQLEPVAIESPESWYRARLAPNEKIAYYRDVFCDDQNPGFVLHLQSNKTAASQQADKLIYGTYKVVRESPPSDNPDDKPKVTWKFFPANVNEGSTLTSEASVPSTPAATKAPIQSH